jgi:hypothetical protein
LRELGHGASQLVDPFFFSTSGGWVETGGNTIICISPWSRERVNGFEAAGDRFIKNARN